MNFFKSCTQQLPEPSLCEDDVTVDDILRKLLIYFGGFLCLIEAKTEIETKCEMEKKENYWSESDIKKAWRERERMHKKKKSAIKHWSRVIVLEELRRRLYDDKCKRQAEADVKEDEKTQACGNAPRNIGKTDEISFNTEPSIVSEDRQIDNDYEKTRNDEEQVEINFCGTKRKHKVPSICIPLSFMSDKIDSEEIDPQTVESSYKLIDGCPTLTKGQENEIRKRKSYVMSYNNKTNNANWVYEILNPSTLAKNLIELNFTNIDYDKGHLAAAANHKWSLEAQNDASLFSNITPQHMTLNNGVWKALENYCRKTAIKTGCNVHVYTGPLYLNPGRERVGGKAVPSHFFKVMIVENDNGTVEEPECYRMPNVTINQSCKYTDDTFKKSIGDIEEDSGLIFVEPARTATISNSIKTITLKGIDAGEHLRIANIKVRISS